MTTHSPVLVALDVATEEELLKLVDQLDPSECRVKVGKELFTLFGPKVLDILHQRGFEVFLDLKFHDIPNTVAAAVRAAAERGVWMVNVHASGGSAMMKAAREALQPYGDKAPILIAVTVLTSMGENELSELGVERSAAEQVSHLARLAQDSGMDGVVCSAQEAEKLRAERGDGFLLVTPGIRPRDSASDDQQRIATPEDAVRMGSNYLVVGRPISRAAEPLAALRDINRALGV
ncbi:MULTISPECIES: orotidine-5'-phosphate decarboxylase [Spongiibacter]|jgi:orotidine-5'-phosphate decarboxylase|uniref:orotidine-5'-phosphate decarboxylase n=1 Tax=Spongiibacter TaxID=630749 RepID=UPI0019619295|nr:MULTISPECIES: orotidine-5'-phosphate decarboxylase [Spongiibacter]MBM7424515.1 orotidine-5'-phosphate decarboxylase [Spongiibacter marinus]|tara:strand:+ start:5421 stop:6122 length:702 start_codon:yes stop_codon:yes gene_type:complete